MRGYHRRVLLTLVRLGRSTSDRVRDDVFFYSQSQFVTLKYPSS